MDELDDKKRLLVSLYVKYNGQIGKACKEGCITRQTFRNWVLNDPIFKEAIEDEWTKRIEEVEDALLKAAKGFTVTTTKTKTKTTSTPKGDIKEEVKEVSEVYFKPCPRSAQLILEAKARHMGYGTKPNDPPPQEQGGKVVGSDEIKSN